MLSRTPFVVLLALCVRMLAHSSGASSTTSIILDNDQGSVQPIQRGPGGVAECVVWRGQEYCATNVSATDGAVLKEEPCGEASVPVGSPGWLKNAGLSLLCVAFAAMAAGLTMGLVSVDPFQLHVVLEADVNDCKTETEKRNLLNDKVCAKKVLPLVNRHHWLLVSLLLMNAVANEALPLFLDKLGLTEIVTIMISVTFVLFFGEIIPSAIFTGPKQLRVSAFFTPFVWVVLVLLSPIAWPISKVLDWCFGHEAVGSLNRTQLKAIVKMHGEPGKIGQGAKEVLRLGGLTPDEITIIGGVLDMTYQTARETMIPLSKVFMLDAESMLDNNLMATIMGAGHSRIPVFQHDRHNIIGLLLVKKLIILDPDDPRRVGDFVFRRPICVTPERHLLDLLNDFQDQQNHMAIVTDNPKALEAALKDINTPVPCDLYLGGIVCIEDVIEKIICEEINDETDALSRGNNVNPKLRGMAAKMLSARKSLRSSISVSNSKQPASVNQKTVQIQMPTDEKSDLKTPLLQY